MFDFVAKLNLLPGLPWWLELVMLPLAAYAVYRWRRAVLLFVGQLLMPVEISKRWDALASKSDLKNVTKVISGEVASELTDQLSGDVVKKLRASVVSQLSKLLSDHLVNRILEKLPEAMERRAAKTIANLTAQVNALRKQLQGEDGWVFLGIHVRGFKMGDGDTEDYFALVEYNIQTGVLRAAQKPSNRRIVPKGKLGYTYSPFSRRQHVITSLGPPWYGRVNGDPESIVMCDESYRLLR